MFDKKSIKVYNSLTNKMQEFTTIKENEVSMYVCGPTVYNHMHIGNGRPVVFFDTVKRFLEYVGFNVKMVMNFTDIDDKIIKKAKEENKTETEVSEYYIEQFLDVCQKVNCSEVYARPKVTLYMNEIINFIDELVKKGYAYASGDDVYFRVHSLKEYGMLSNQKVDNLESGARIEVNEQKESPIDFTLWKKTSDDGIKWESPFGAGRPGWHTECVVMINKLLGSVIDIHGGGNDLKFPHHENEVAQSMALNNSPLANFWMHNARIDLKGEKMSKSLGNVIWLKDLIEKYKPQAYRLLILSNNYLQTINYDDEIMIQMVNEWEKIDKVYTSLYRKIELSDELALMCQLKDFNKEELMKEFLNGFANNFNTSLAVTSLYELMKLINKDMRNKNANLEDICSEYLAFRDMLNILGLKPSVKPLSNDEKELVLKWHDARNNKDFELADKLRVKITEKGIVL